MRKKRKTNGGGLCLFLLQIIASAVFAGLIAVLDILPGELLFLVILVLLLLTGITFFSQRYKKTRYIGKIYSLIVLALLLLGNIYLGKTWAALQRVTDPGQNLQSSHQISIIVLAEDSAESLEDAREYRFGIQHVIDRENTDRLLKKIEDTLTTKVNAVEFDSYRAQVEALYHQQIRVMVMNEAYRGLVEEEHKDFNQKTRILKTFDLKQEHQQEESKVENEGGNIMKDPFIVFLSGIDTYGKISLKSRSDVNILAAVNPATKQILLLTTPRDYYVELARHEGAMDKLTHAGLYGVEVSMETLENLYGVEVDYYVRVNFSGFENIINALGGVEVYSPKAFSTATGQSFQKGMNRMNGEEALAFVRERYSFAEGDIQRGRNQMALIEAVIDKALSPALLTNYLSLLDSVSESFVTSIPSSEITSLVKMQLKDNASWNIVAYNVSGKNGSETTYSYGNERLYVMIPDMDTVNQAKELLRQVQQGEILSKPEENS